MENIPFYSLSINVYIDIIDMLWLIYIVIEEEDRYKPALLLFYENFEIWNQCFYCVGEISTIAIIVLWKLGKLKPSL